MERRTWQPAADGSSSRPVGGREAPTNTPTLRAVLDDIGTINAFFAVDPEPPEGEPHPIAELWNRPELLTAEVAEVRSRLAGRAGLNETDVEPRVAASILYQGLAARLLSPVVGAALCHGLAPDPAALRWTPARTGPLSFAIAEGAGIAVDAAAPDQTESAAHLVRERVLEGALAPLGAALRTQVKVAPRLLWGNAASSLAGAVGAVAAARPERTEDAYALARHLLAGEPLAGLGGFVQPTPGGGRFFVRTSCCLYYRLPGCAMCGDCALLPEHTRRAQWAGTARHR